MGSVNANDDAIVAGKVKKTGSAPKLSACKIMSMVVTDGSPDGSRMLPNCDSLQTITHTGDVILGHTRHNYQ